MTTDHHPNALPSGAVDATAWEEDRNGRVCRYLSGPTRSIDGSDPKTGARVLIQGEQEYGGRVLSRFVVVDTNRRGAEMSSDQARELAAVLLEAADEIDRWTALTQ